MPGRERSDAARLAEDIRDAARLAALDAVDAVARIAADPGAEAPDRSRDVANRALTCAAVMQAGLDQFVSAVRRRR